MYNEEEIQNLNTEQQKALALAQFLKLEPEEGQTLDSYLSQIVSTDYDPNTFEVNGEEYLVLTDDEADQLYDERLDSYIDDVILPELPEAYRYYFDDEKWINDAKIDGSRGIELATYDSNEESEMVNGTEYFIYRTN